MDECVLDVSAVICHKDTVVQVVSTCVPQDLELWISK